MYRELLAKTFTIWIQHWRVKYDENCAMVGGPIPAEGVVGINHQIQLSESESDYVLRRALFEHSVEQHEEVSRNSGLGKLPSSF